MSHAPAENAEVSLQPSEGWHCSHLFYRFDRATLAAMTPAEIKDGRATLATILNPETPGARRLQTSIVAGHKADFAR